jgi:phosphoribosylformylglycinamidine synthase
LNPYKGGLIAVCESARNVACTGAEPVAVTNCLNFGNPYKPEVYHMFREAVRGIGDACRMLETPVTGGNVSFYNESPDYAVYPTPVIGMMGIIDNIEHVTTSYFKNEGDLIALIGSEPKGFDGIGGSEYLKLIHNKVTGDAPDIDPVLEKSLQKTLLVLIRKGHIKSAHDIADGGFAAAIAECCVMNRKNVTGCEVKFEYSGRKDFALFNEAQSRIIISFDEKSLTEIENTCETNGIKINVIGIVRGKSLKINKDINLNLEIVSDSYYYSIKNIMEDT